MNQFGFSNDISLNIKNLDFNPDTHIPLKENSKSDKQQKFQKFRRPNTNSLPLQN